MKRNMTEQELAAWLDDKLESIQWELEQVKGFAAKNNTIRLCNRDMAKALHALKDARASARLHAREPGHAMEVAR